VCKDMTQSDGHCSHCTESHRHDPHWDMASLATDYEHFSQEECDDNADACIADLETECEKTRPTEECTTINKQACLQEKLSCALKQKVFYNENKEIQHLHLEILTRPISPSAREEMAGQKAVGKGLDIKPKSSKGYNKGYIPIVQSCEYHLADQKQIESNTKHKQIICKSTQRPMGEESQNEKAKDLLKYDETQPLVPMGVDKRVCIKKKVETETVGKTGVNHLFGYQAGKHVLPVVSDYDLLAIAECPKGRPGQRLYNIEDNYYMHLANAIKAYTDRRHNNQKDCNNDPHNKVMNDCTGALNEYNHATLGLSSTRMRIFLGYAITVFSESHGALRHGQEAENYAYPQDFDTEANHTIFLPKYEKQNRGKTEHVPWKEVNEMSGIQEWYKQKLEHGCCVPMNMMWLLTNNNIGFGETYWREIYDIGKAQGKEALKECPWWAEEGKFMKTMMTLEKYFQ